MYGIWSLASSVLYWGRMYLKEMTLQGFKTFAKKTTLQFLEPKANAHGITAIVGPNGSGKSNVADGIRWVLGEQSMKTLRGKATHDVIFSGSDGKNRSGFAEVTVVFGDADKVEGVDTSELSITRRLYRDGESQYQINNQSVRLGDIHMLLAQANVGQKSYAIINQGQIDRVLSATPEERKAFFDDATGVKPLQLKRHKATLKLNRTRDNLVQAELLLEELAPRLRTLKRLVNRLGQREEVETKLHAKQIEYYGTLWNTLQEKMKAELSVFKTHEKGVKEQTAVFQKERDQFKKLEAAEKASEEKPEESAELSALQDRYETLQEKRNKVREDRFEIEKKLELEKAASVSSWTPLPLTKIIEGIGSISKLVSNLKKKLKDGALTEADLDEAEKASSGLLNRLQKPAPTDYKPDPELLKQLEALKKDDAKIVTELTTLKQSMNDLASASKNDRKELFALQHRMLEAQEKLHDLETLLNERRVSLARLETRTEDLEKEMGEVLGDQIKAAKDYKDGADTDALYPEIQQLRHKLDLIGGIDEETVAEFNEAKERHDFLDNQIADLVQALNDTEKIIKELDAQIKDQSTKTFKEIQKHFEHYFKILFRGGSCSLKEIRAKDIAKEAPPTEEDEEAAPKMSKEEGERVVGVEIQATPPGKKLKNINLLSGGERALTSIALISAIMATNPSPFVVLDEVDAALDEANTMRFAEIVEELSGKTQFVIITHNRATMHAADALYGVTMQSDGISQLISVKLEEIEKNGTARR